MSIFIKKIMDQLMNEFLVAEAVPFKSVLSVDVYFQINIIVRLLSGS